MESGIKLFGGCVSRGLTLMRATRLDSYSRNETARLRLCTYLADIGHLKDQIAVAPLLTLRISRAKPGKGHDDGSYLW